MDGSTAPVQSKPSASPGAESNLDSFFKRLGQGQGSRLWAGSGRSGAVPGSLRTRLHPRVEGSGEPSVGTTPATASGSGGSTAAAGSERQLEAGSNGAGRGPSGVGGGGERRRRDRKASEGSPSSVGNREGSSELEGIGGSGDGAKGADRLASKTFRSQTSSGSNFAGRHGASGSRTPFNSGSSSLLDVSDDPLRAPPSPSAAPPPLPPSIAASSPRVASSRPSAAAVATTPGKASPKPAGKPSAKAPAASTPSPLLASRPSYRDKRFDDILSEEVVKLDELRKLSWNGVPPAHRAVVWQLLVGYMPANRTRRSVAMERKRREYREAVPQYFDVPDAARSHQEQNILRQILVDVPRTCPDVPFFHQEKVQRAMERILYIWAIRHPASGYVQGINDIMTPLYIVFLSAHVGPAVESKDVSKVDQVLLDEVEADVYWCLTKLLDNIQDHYTAMQPGLQRMVLRLEELVQRIDAELHRHMMEQGLLYIQFAFRWMNCLLMRELPQRAVIRAWDTYLAEENGFESFHVYVSAALLCHFSAALREMDFQTMVMFLQDIPTKEWGEEEVEPLLSQAYILSTLFERSPNHLGAPA